jgi:hypothetical protein
MLRTHSPVTLDRNHHTIWHVSRRPLVTESHAEVGRHLSQGGWDQGHTIVIQAAYTCSDAAWNRSPLSVPLMGRTAQYSTPKRRRGANLQLHTNGCLVLNCYCNGGGLHAASPCCATPPIHPARDANCSPTPHSHSNVRSVMSHSGASVTICTQSPRSSNQRGGDSLSSNVSREPGVSCVCAGKGKAR